jgi:hypothetical protein
LIELKTLLLSILTLGVYSFWGRTEVRKYVWSQSEFEGDRFAYHGTGGELLRGWLKAILFVFLPAILLLATVGALLEFRLLRAGRPSSRGGHSLELSSRPAICAGAGRPLQDQEGRPKRSR